MKKRVRKKLTERLQEMVFMGFFARDPLLEAVRAQVRARDSTRAQKPGGGE